MNGELPKGWVWTSLENCVDILDSQRKPINSEERQERILNKNESDLYPYYGATGQVGWIDGYIFDEELILLGEDGAPFLDFTKDKSYLIKGKTWVNNHAHVLRAIKDISFNSYICHYLNSFDYRNYITGTTRYKLNQSQMRKIMIPLPPLAEQQRIVNKIEELFTNLDKGIESLEQVKYKLKIYRQAILKYAMEGKLTEKWRENNKTFFEESNSFDNKEVIAFEIPSSWRLVELKDVSIIILGQSPPSSTYNEKRIGLPFYQGKSEFGLIYPTPVKWCAFPKKIAEKGDVLISVRAPVGPTNICPEKSCIGRGLAAIRGLGNIDNKFIFYLLRNIEKDISSQATGTTFEAIRGDVLKKLIIPLPPLEEQQEIVNRIEKLFSLADHIEETVSSKLEQSKTLRQSILKKAFEGQLVPQDPNDEPAEILLEKIKMEKLNKGKAIQEKLVQ
ncbi:MAG: restriction endonuclease subunit S [Candidatus Methanofastidiosum sp.]|nr:restriction endonuclease subunit S [Methanofastidiosum sp.]